MPSKTLDLEGSSRYRQLPSPPGFSRSLATARPSKSSTASTAAYDQLKERRAWNMAIAPAKSLPMQAFMLYIYSAWAMGIVAMLLWTPFKNIAGITEGIVCAICAIDSAAKILPLQKTVYVLCNLLTLAVGLWKCRSMGLLPTGTGDWLAFETRGLVRFVLLS
ncbi:DUF1077-domain-containing protein [Armillaria solidipes]|uniref:ER membrane protein complex subunit 4 n=1 Tax=Armillaria solidipes TaxID=1076256 RepID=A0A2H3B8D9_9AGAR|nr:DUF1077-domain-containing protein [Armillaria solidipes]